MTLVLILDHNSVDNVNNELLQSSTKADVSTDRTMDTGKKMKKKKGATITRPPIVPIPTTPAQKQDAVFKTYQSAAVGVQETSKSETSTITSKSAQKQIPVDEDSVHHQHHHHHHRSNHRGMQSSAQRFLQRFESFRLARFIQDATVLAKDDSAMGKLVMIIMSTVISIFVGVFGALLFVVALKIRIFQSRRWSHQPQGLSPPRIGVHHEMQSIGGCKRVIPRGILDSFSVQTVLHTSAATMTTTAIVEPNLAVFIKPKYCFAEDVNGMEEGLDDIFTRDVTQRRPRTRPSLFPRGWSTLQSQNFSDDTVGFEQFMEGNDYVGEDEDEARWESFDNEEVEEMTASEMERITAAIMNATRRGSYHDISQSSSEQRRLRGSSSSSSSYSLQQAQPQQQQSLCEDKCSSGHGHGQEEQGKEKLPFDNANSQTLCSICLTDYEVGDQVRTLPCYHQYHTSCIDPWLLTVASLCPICKRDLLPGGLA
ncbi:E3 ubiquitin-protein ligase rnf13 [Entomortierella lignicola]|nr:E3 ubiquitin-protein ligase rnf13 [Entomortierella lignicola]